MNKIITKIKKIYIKYKEAFLYLFFGVCTVIVNTLSYSLLYEQLKINNLLSTILAWLVAVLFAFFTNKKFVFNSSRDTMLEKLKEISAFFLCRILTGVLDVAIMVVAVDCMHWNSIFWKLTSNIIVTLLNYIASKLFIFRKK